MARPDIAAIDRLNGAGANEEFTVIVRQLKRLAFRATPLPLSETPLTGASRSRWPVSSRSRSISNLGAGLARPPRIRRGAAGRSNQRACFTPASRHGSARLIVSVNVVSASEDTPVSEIAALLERHRITRVPIVTNGKVIGIVSRSNLIQALASSKPAVDSRRESDCTIRLELLNRLEQQQWTDFFSRNVIVEDGVVHLWGLVGSESERKALIALAQEVPGVSDVAAKMILAY